MKKIKFLLLFTFAAFFLLPFNVNAMQIFIQPSEGDVFNIEVESSDTIETVKNKIFIVNNIFLISEQKLYFNNKEMTDGRTLGDYEGLTKGSIVQLEIVKDTPVSIILNSNGGVFEDNNEEYLIEDFYGTDEEVYPTREGYVFKGYYTEKDGGLTIDYYDKQNEITSGMTFYAHWDVIGTTTIDFTKLIHANNMTDLENASLYVMYTNGTLIIDETDRTIKNKNGKVLVKVDDEEYITVTENLTSSDNFVHTLTDEEKQQILDTYNKIEYIPDKIELIFSEEKVYNIVFDANGGKFGTETSYTIDNWNAELYDSLTIPTRDGYIFKGYYTEKNSGIKFEMILNESGIDSDMTFYAQWEENLATDPSIKEEENPKTFDGIESSVFMGTVSLIGLVGATIYLRKKNKLRA